MVQKIVTFDVALKSTERQWVQKVPEVYTNDLGSVSIQFKITDCTDVELTGSTAIVLLKMRDGSFYQGPSPDVERTLNVFSYNLKENEGNHDGLAEIQLVVTIAGKEFGTQKYNFKVISGLDSEIAREIMIYDWSTLTAEARAYIDAFTADEILRDAEFDNNQFDRNVAFNAAQGQRTTDFGLAQTQRNTDFGSAQAQRVNDFNAAEAARVLAFNNAETARAAGYTADHSRAGTDHSTALNDSSLAATARTNAAADRTLAATDHTTASGDHTTALSDHAVLIGYDGRLTDVEVDTSVDATNILYNSDFALGVTAWFGGSSTLTLSSDVITVLATARFGGASQVAVTLPVSSYRNHLVYYHAWIQRDSKDVALYLNDGTDQSEGVENGRIDDTFKSVSGIRKMSNLAITLSFVLQDNRVSGWTASKMKRPSVLDLTATFGAGNEPTVEQMDAIMAKFENSWFDGTKNLFQAKASLNKLMALDARTEFEMKNLVNGDCVTGWNYINVTPTILGNEVTMVTTVTSARLELKVGAQSYNDKIYTRFSKLTPSYQTGYGGVAVCLPAETTFAMPPNNDLWNTYSGINTMGSNGNFILRLYMNNTVLGVTHKVKNVSVINLTAAFGAGKEPTLAEMDRLMARFPNSWFDGVKPIQTIETLYQEKANKVQEAWITPTLLNGWTNGTYPIQYRKNEFGEIVLRGSAIPGTGTIFILPSGYRPQNFLSFPMNSGDGIGLLQVRADGVVHRLTGTGAWIVINGMFQI